MRQDKVTPEVREYVLNRDVRCVMFLRDSGHACYDVFGNVHGSGDKSKLTLEHVKDYLRMGKRGPSDPAHLVALCGYRNVIRPLTKVEREWVRSYLRAVEAAA